MENTAEAITIHEIIERGWVGTAFHSLVSIKRRALLGVLPLSILIFPQQLNPARRTPCAPRQRDGCRKMSWAP